MYYIQSAERTKRHGLRNHDQRMLDDEHAAYFVFDGANNAFASRRAAHTIGALAASGEFGIGQALTQAHHDILARRRFRSRRTTAMGIHIIDLETDTPIVRYGFAGDSPGFIVGHSTASFAKFAGEEERHTPDGHIDPRGFLGSRGYRKSHHGELQINEPTTIALATDGLTKALQQWRVHNLLLETREAPANETADALIAQAEHTGIQDDTTLIVVKFRPTV